MSMLCIPGQPGKDLCDRNLGVTRRDILRVGGSAFLGMSLGGMLKLQSAQGATTSQPAPAGGPGWGKAKSVILIYLQGGPSHLDLWDPKENVPDNVKSVFKKIPSKVPGMENVYVATGFAGTGLTWGTVAGTLIARMIQKQRHPLESILSPGRITVMASAKDVIAENLDVMRRFVVDRFAAKSLTDEQIAPGCGQIVSRNGRLMAIYRDPSGSIFRLSPVCQHAGCIVHWNEAERTWDCPCHGGRYMADGRRFYGRDRVSEPSR